MSKLVYRQLIIANDEYQKVQFQVFKHGSRRLHAIIKQSSGHPLSLILEIKGTVVLLACISDKYTLQSAKDDAHGEGLKISRNEKQQSYIILHEFYSNFKVV